MLKNNKEFNKIINNVVQNFLNLKSLNNFNDLKNASRIMIDALKKIRLFFVAMVVRRR